MASSEISKPPESPRWPTRPPRTGYELADRLARLVVGKVLSDWGTLLRAVVLLVAVALLIAVVGIMVKLSLPTWGAVAGMTGSMFGVALLRRLANGRRGRR